MEPTEARRPYISEAEADAILRRAIELDQQKQSGLSLDQLREIAAEVGVSEESLELALKEVSSNHHRSVATPALAAWRAGLIGAAFGLAFLVFGDLPSRATAYSESFPEGVAIIATIALAALGRGRRLFRQFYRNTASFWLGFLISQTLAVAAALPLGRAAEVLGAIVRVTSIFAPFGLLCGSVLVMIHVIRERLRIRSGGEGTGNVPPQAASAPVRDWSTWIVDKWRSVSRTFRLGNWEIQRSA